MKWTDVFDLKYDAETSDINDLHHRSQPNGKFLLVDKSTGKVVGTYDDQSYAIKQAKHKFKRYVKKVERMLLG